MSQRALTALAKALPQGSKVLCLQDDQLIIAQALHDLGFEALVSFFTKPSLTYPALDKITQLPSDFFEAAFPWRSLQAIYCNLSLSKFTPEILANFLRKAQDILHLQGLLYVHALEGEGRKIVRPDSANQKDKLVLQYYQAADLQNLFSSLDYTVQDAWRHEHSIHLIVGI